MISRIILNIILCKYRLQVQNSPIKKLNLKSYHQNFKENAEIFSGKFSIFILNLDSLKEEIPIIKPDIKEEKKLKQKIKDMNGQLIYFIITTESDIKQVFETRNKIDELKKLIEENSKN